MNQTVSIRYELLARYAALDQVIDAITIPDNLNLDQAYGALLVADQVIEAVKAQKMAIRDALAKLI